MNARLQEHWVKCRNSKLVSERKEIRTNSIRPHSALSIAKWLCQKASKKNFPLFGALKPQPTSSSKWVGEPDQEYTHFRAYHRPPDGHFLWCSCIQVLLNQFSGFKSPSTVTSKLQALQRRICDPENCARKLILWFDSCLSVWKICTV